MRSYNDLNMYYQGGDLKIKLRSLKSLDGSPNHITGNFICRLNDITSLVGGPQYVDKNYDCSWNQLTDLDGIPSTIAILGAFGNNITSLVGIHKIIKSCERFYFDTNKITVGGIGLLLISNLVNIENGAEEEIIDPFKIIINYLGQGTKGMMECSKELISKGYTPYAKL